MQFRFIAQACNLRLDTLLHQPPRPLSYSEVTKSLLRLLLYLDAALALLDANCLLDHPGVAGVIITRGLACEKVQL